MQLIGIKHLLVILFIIVGTVLGLTGAKSQAATAPVKMDGSEWLIGSNDLITAGNIGHYEWDMCGVSANSGTGTVPPCDSETNVTSFASYWKLQWNLEHGVIKKGATIMFDQEGWAITPKLESTHPIHYMLLAVALTKKYGVNMINATVPTGVTVPKGETRPEANQAAGRLYAVDAAKAGVYMDDYQDQSYTSDVALFGSVAKKYVAAVHAANKHTLVMDNIGTDSGGFPVNGVPAATMFASYNAAHKAGVSNFWLEFPKWASACDDSGCPANGDAFLALLGVS